MTLDADDRHCDSLTGTAIGSEARTSAPSFAPAPRRLSIERLAGFFVAGLALAGAANSVLHQRALVSRTPESTLDSLHVAGSTVSYSPRFAVRAGIRTMEVKQSAFSPVISGTGMTRFDPTQVAAIDAGALGTVRRVIKYEGDNVKPGEVLAEIGSPLSARMDAAALREESALRGTLGVSVVRSPLEGTVIERRVVTGQSVRGERVLFVVANLDRLFVDVAVDRGQARTLRVSDRAELSRDGSPGSPVAGSITELDTSDSSSSAMRVRIAVDNRGRNLRLGQAVSARIFSSTGTRALLIPNRAVAWIAGRPTVFVSNGRNSARAAGVTLGGSNGDQTEVQVGLVPGQRIVTDGVRTLKDESFL